MKIAAYCRVSTDKEEQLDSLAHQKDFFAAFASKNGHQLVAVYADEGISGTSLKKRTEFQRLMHDAGEGRFEMVVVKDISRFARNTVDFLQSIRTLKALGINTLFLTANMESLGESEFILTVFGALAQEESVNLSKRVKFGKKINAQKGRVPTRIFGYDRLDNFTLAINEKEAEVVRKIYRLYLDEGLGCRAISLALNRLEYKTKFDGEWNPRGVRRVLTNPIYCGDLVNNKYEIKDCLNGRQVRIPPDQQLHHARPEWGIVSPEDFRRVQSALKERRQQYHSDKPSQGGRYSDKHVFSTLIRCAQCGRSFTRKHYTYANTRVYWKCPTNDQLTAEHCDNRVTVTEEVLLEEIRRYFVSVVPNKEDFVRDIIHQVEKDMKTGEKRNGNTELQKRLKRLKTRQEKYRELYADEMLSMEELKEKTATITKEIEHLNAQLAQMNTNETRSSRIQTYRYEIEKFLSLENLTNGDLRKIIHRIVVNRDGEIHIYLRSFADFTT